jgi:hypothetical protein
MDGLPIDENHRLELVVRETARMAYPGNMGRGANRVLVAGAKQAVEDWFSAGFPIGHVWHEAQAVAEQYACWHEEQTRAMCGVVQAYMGNQENESQTIAAKILDTFMHQLMKYEPCRPLWKELHLPLDSKVFGALWHHHPPALAGVHHLFHGPPYAITYEQYRQVQDALWGFVAEHWGPGAEVQFTSRIELNWLWL